MSNRPAALSESVRALAMQKLSSWTEKNDGKAMAKTFTFKDFSEAWAFMSRSALLAEQLDHHPEWFNVYNRVEVTLNTHDAGDGGALTELDIKMATAMDKFAG